MLRKYDSDISLPPPASRSDYIMHKARYGRAKERKWKGKARRERVGRKANDACVALPSYFYSFVPKNLQPLIGKDP